MAESRYTEAQINAGNYAMSLSPYERRRQLTEEQRETVSQMLEAGLLSASRASSDISIQADRPRRLTSRDMIEEEKEKLGRWVDASDSAMGGYRLPTKESIDRSMKRLDEPFWGVKEEEDKIRPGAFKRDIGRIFNITTGAPLRREFLYAPIVPILAGEYYKRKIDPRPSELDYIRSFLKGDMSLITGEKAVERRESARKFGQAIAENIISSDVDKSFLIKRDPENEIKFSLFGLTDEDIEEMRSETGQIQPSLSDQETLVGQVGYMGGFIIGFGKIRGAISGLKLLNLKNYDKAVKFTNEVVRNSLAGGAAGQLFLDPDETLFTYLEDNFSSLDNSDIIKFLSIDQEDSRLERRLKLLGEDFIIGAGFDLALGTIAATGRVAKENIPKGAAMFSSAFQKLSYTMYSVPLQKLENTQKGEVFVEWLRQIKDKLPTDALPRIIPRASKPTLTNTEAERQANSFLFRWRKRWASTRGFLDKPAHNIFRDEEYAKRQSTATGESLSRMLDLALTRIIGATKSKTIMETTQKALAARGGGKGMRWKFLDEGEAPKRVTTTSRGNPKKYSVLEKIDEDGWVDQGTKTVKKTWDELTDTQKVAIYYNIPEEVAAPLYQARTLIDDLSDELMEYIPKGGKESELYKTMSENLGRYLNKSYRAFEDQGFKPDSNLKEKVIEYYQNKLAKTQAKAKLKGEDPPFGEWLDDPALKAKATRNLITKYGDMTQIDDYTRNARAAGSGILKKRGKPPKILREYLGEIKDPGANVILTISKMANLLSRARFQDKLYEAGKGKYILRDDELINDDLIRTFDTKIESINPKLDGMWTDKYTARAIRNEESTFSIVHADNWLSKGYRGYLRFKGMGQASKTILSHVTHLRNASGGLFFLAANGSNPFLGGGIVKATNALLAKTDDELKVYLDEYTRLGIVNTKVDVNQFRELMKTELSSFKRPTSLVDLDRSPYARNKFDQIVGSTADRVSNSVLKKAYDTTESIYMATDDFFKIASYESDLAVYKIARGIDESDVSEAGVEALNAVKGEVAEIVRNTIPNYDLIPQGIKALREMPLGNFVAFPAEVIRTSLNIITQATKEIGSGNKVIVERGLKRLAGFATVMTGPDNLEQVSIEQMGWTPEQAAWANTLVSPEWSQDSPKIWMLSEEGRLFYNDTQFANPYSYAQEFVRASYRELQTGQLEGKQAVELAFNVIMEGATTFMKPYISPSILTKGIEEVAWAVFSKDGRSREGKQLFAPDAPLAERAGTAIFELINTFEPGTITSLKKLMEAKVGTPNKYTGKQTDLNAELLVNLTGIKYTPVDFEDSLEFAIGDYVQAERRISREAITYTTRDQDVVDHYLQRQEYLYELQQILFRRIEAANGLLGERKTRRILRNNPNISNVRADALSDGIFKPEELSDERYEAMRNMPGIENRRRVRRNINRLRRQMTNTNLIIPKESTIDYSDNPLVHKGESSFTPSTIKNLFEEFYEGGREAFAKGGEVDIPQAPPEPDERIDKMTGLPYDLQAGGAFVDEEDRKSFSIGSRVLKRAVTFAGKNSNTSNEPKTTTRDRDLELLSRDFTRLSDGLDVNENEMNAAIKRLRDRLRENDGVLDEPPQKMDSELEDIEDSLVLEKQSDDVDSNQYSTGGKVLGSLQRTRRAKGGGIFESIGSWINKKAKELGFDDRRQLSISADATKINNQMVESGQLPERNRVTWGTIAAGPPEDPEHPERGPHRIISPDELPEAGTRKKIGFVPNPDGNMGEEVFYDAINHALFGYESAESQKAKWGGQLKEVYQGVQESREGRNWRTEHKDLWNNQWGIDQRQKGLTREEFDQEVVKAILESQRKLEAGETLRMGKDLIISPQTLDQSWLPRRAYRKQ